MGKTAQWEKAKENGGVKVWVLQTDVGQDDWVQGLNETDQVIRLCQGSVWGGCGWAEGSWISSRVGGWG